MDANGAPWTLLNDRQNAQGERISTIEEAMRTHSAQSLRVEERTEGRLSNLERDVASIKTTMRLVGGAVVVCTPLLTAILLKVIG